MLIAAAALSLGIWLYLILGHGGFWRVRMLPEAPPAGAAPWPEVLAIVPARDEAAVIARAVTALLGQDYPARLHVVVVDDHSQDGTAEAALAAARAAGGAGRLDVVAARPRPAGWAGKVWALAEGLARGGTMAPTAPYVWLSDADIVHAPGTLGALVAKARAERRDLVSLMAMLSCAAPWERLLIPPFVYFFQMLYPFAWANDPRRRAAAAAGGCVLARRAALAAIGGFESIKGALIDDCALARRIKDLTLAGHGAAAGGGIWVGFALGTRSIRPYEGLRGIWTMVARTAYTQLAYSPALLAGTVLALALIYLVPPAAVLALPAHGAPVAAALGLAAWTTMALSMGPTLSLYGQPRWLGVALPVAGALYGAMTVDSALRHWRGRGGAWKGRTHAARRALERKPPGL